MSKTDPMWVFENYAGAAELIDELEAKLAALESQQAASVGGEREAFEDFDLRQWWYLELAALANTADQRRAMAVVRNLMRQFEQARAAIEARHPGLGLDQYDAGLLNDFGGGNVEWWQDYIRAELGRAHDFYQSQCAALESQQAASVGGEREAHVEFLLDEFDTGLEDLELRGRHSDLGYQKLKGLLPQFRAALSPASGGVVMPERKTCADGYPSDDWLCATAWNACLDEVARLNAKPQANSQEAE